MMGLIFVNLMTYGGALVSLFNPFAGFLVFVSFGILKPEAVWPWSVAPGNNSRTIALALLAGWAMKGFGSWELGRSKPILLALVGYLGWMTLSATLAPDQALAWASVENTAKIVLPFLVGITTINSVKQLKLLAWVVVISQSYPAYELNMTYFGGYNQLREEGFAGFDNNSYAIALVAGIGLAGFLFWHSTKWWQKTIILLSAAFMVHAVLFSFSRGGMLGLIVVGVVAFVVMPKGHKELWAFGLAVVLGLALAGPQVQARFATAFAEKSQRDESAESRLELWAACFDTMAKNPIVGVGPDHMPLHMEEFGFKKGKEAHTLWLQLGAELGLPGLLLLIAFYSSCVIRLIPIARDELSVSDPWLSYLTRGVIAALCGFAVSAQFVSLEGLEMPYYIALIGAGVLKLSTTKRL
jgi:probable O-glycosylation ligase (exosortase A-associated)